MPQVPPLSDLQRYNPNRADAPEGIRQSLYDFTPYAAAGQTSLSFFQVPAGQGGKTKADTNMEAAGSLPNPKHFLIQTIEIFFFPAGDPAIATLPENINDVYDVFKSGWLDLFIGSKSYLTEAPIGRFPPKNMLVGFAGMSAAAMNAAYASMGGRVYQVTPPLLLVPTQNFSVTLNWPAAVPIAAAARIGVVMDGLLYRLSQ
jgi:hypothetical protein